MAKEPESIYKQPADYSHSRDLAGSEPPKRATFDEVWAHLRQFMPDDFTTQQAIIVMDGFGWIDNGPCTCGLEIYGDPCPHHSQNQANVTTLRKVIYGN